MILSYSDVIPFQRDQATDATHWCHPLAPPTGSTHWLPQELYHPGTLLFADLQRVLQTHHCLFWNSPGSLNPSWTQKISLVGFFLRKVPLRQVRLSTQKQTGSRKRWRQRKMTKGWKRLLGGGGVGVANT